MKKILLSGVAGAALLMYAAPSMAGGITLIQGEAEAQGMRTNASNGEGGGSPVANAEGGQIQGQAQFASIDWTGPLATSSSTSSVGPITINVDPVPGGNKAEATKGGIATAGDSNIVNIDSWNTKQSNDSDLKALNIKSGVTNEAGDAGAGGSADVSNDIDQEMKGSAKGGKAEVKNEFKDNSATASSGNATASSGNATASSGRATASSGKADASTSLKVDDTVNAGDANVSAKDNVLAAASSGGQGGSASGSGATGGAGGEGSSSAGDLNQDGATGGDAWNDQDGKADAHSGDATATSGDATATSGDATATTGDALATNSADQDGTATGGNAGNDQDQKAVAAGTATGGNGGGSNQVFAWTGTGSVGAVLLNNVRGITNIAMSSGMNVNQNISVSVNASASFN